MKYFDDIAFIAGQVLPDCRAVVDCGFPQTFNLQFVLEGSVYFGIDGGGRIVLDRPAVFWHHPSHTYQYGPAESGKGWFHNWVTFQGARGRAIMEKGFMELSPRGFAYVAQPKAYAEIFARLVDLVQSPGRERHPEAVMLLEQLLALLCTGERGLATDSAHGTALDGAVSRMRVSPYAVHDFKKIALKMGLSYSHFRRLFRLKTGMAPYEFLLDCRMRAAARELEDPARQVKDVALQAGFGDPAQFSKLFRNKIGLSPANYRKAIFK